MNDSTLYLSKIRVSYPGIVIFSRNVRTLVARWYINYRTRRQLAELDSYQLQDIGVSRSEALEELRKPFWRA